MKDLVTLLFVLASIILVLKHKQHSEGFEESIAPAVQETARSTRRQNNNCIEKAENTFEKFMQKNNDIYLREYISNLRKVFVYHMDSLDERPCVTPKLVKSKIKSEIHNISRDVFALVEKNKNSYIGKILKLNESDTLRLFEKALNYNYLAKIINTRQNRKSQTLKGKTITLAQNNNVVANSMNDINSNGDIMSLRIENQKLKKLLDAHGIPKMNLEQPQKNRKSQKLIGDTLTLSQLNEFEQQKNRKSQKLNGDTLTLSQLNEFEPPNKTDEDDPFEQRFDIESQKSSLNCNESWDSWTNKNDGMTYADYCREMTSGPCRKSFCSGKETKNNCKNECK